MKFELKMHPEKCEIILNTGDNTPCPLVINDGDCIEHNKHLEWGKTQHFYKRCPQCIAEEKRQEGEAKP